MSVTENLKAIGVDVERGLKSVANNEDLYLKLLGKVGRHADKGLEVFKNPGSSLSDTAFEAHTIKGVMYNLGVMAVGDIARDVEMAARDGDGERAAELLPAFIETLADFTEKLTEALKG